MPALLIRTSRGPYRRRTRSAPAAPLPSSVTSIRTYPAPSPSEAGCPAAASRAAEQGGMAGGEKRAGRLAAEPLLAPVIGVTGAEATSYSMTPRSPGGRRRARLRPADPDGHRLAHHSRRRARWRRLHLRPQPTRGRRGRQRACRRQGRRPVQREHRRPDAARWPRGRGRDRAAAQPEPGSARWNCGGCERATSLTTGRPCWCAAPYSTPAGAAVRFARLTARSRPGRPALIYTGCTRTPATT